VFGGGAVSGFDVGGAGDGGDAGIFGDDRGGDLGGALDAVWAECVRDRGEREFGAPDGASGGGDEDRGVCVQRILRGVGRGGLRVGDGVGESGDRAWNGAGRDRLRGDRRDAFDGRRGVCGGDVLGGDDFRDDQDGARFRW